MATAQPCRYNGVGFSLQRDKARFVLPSQFRRIVKESSEGSTLCLTRHDRWPCLIGFGLSRADEIDAQLDREGDLAARTTTPFDRDEREFQLRGFTEMPFDDSGRFVLQQHLADMVGIDEEIYFQGSGAFFTLFAPDKLFEMGAAFDVAKATCRQMQADARGKVRRP